ncbi:MAG: glycine betaine ABC transporter substrate-binding protein [bacterium]
MNKIKSLLIIVITAGMLLGAHSALACVGRKLIIGYMPFTEQAILAQMLAIMVEERTGTKVSLKELEDSVEAHRALEANEIQLYIEYTGIGVSEVLGVKPDKNAKVLYRQAKKAYNKNFNIIWLKRFGYSSTYTEFADFIKQGIPLDPAPVVRKSTLKKFPALSRLLNKLKGKISVKQINSMIVQVEREGKKPREVASRFLSNLGISFSFNPGRA